MEYKDYYKILGVSKTADEKEIKKAYRKLARQYHPDLNPGDTAAENRFKEINEAYEALSDAEKRKMYDQFGSQWQQYQRGGGNPNDFWRQWQSNQGTSGGYRQTINAEQFEQMFGSTGGGFSDFFEALFGSMGGAGGFNHAGQGQTRARRGQDAEHTVQLTLLEALQGSTRQLKWEDGRTINAKIPPGVKTGSRIRLAGQGNPGMGGAPAGDLYLTVELLPDSTYQREEDNLRITLPVDLYTAVLGGQLTVPTLERQVNLTIPEGTANGTQFRLRGLGMPKLKNPSERGDLLVTVSVTLPSPLSDQERQLFRQLRDLRP